MIIYQTWITRQDLQNNPDVLFLFGDNLAGKGFGGQAKEMRGEPNAIGIPTKKAPSMKSSAFFCDEDIHEWYDIINERLRPVRTHLTKGGDVVVPMDGLGSGLAQLAKKAPKINRFLLAELSLLSLIGPRERLINDR